MKIPSREHPKNNTPCGGKLERMVTSGTGQALRGATRASVRNEIQPVSRDRMRSSSSRGGALRKGSRERNSPSEEIREMPRYADRRYGQTDRRTDLPAYTAFHKARRVRFRPASFCRSLVEDGVPFGDVLCLAIVLSGSRRRYRRCWVSKAKKPVRGITITHAPSLSLSLVSFFFSLSFSPPRRCYALVVFRSEYKQNTALRRRRDNDDGVDDEIARRAPLLKRDIKRGLPFPFSEIHIYSARRPTVLVAGGTNKKSRG